VGFEAGLGFGIEWEHTVLRVALDAVVADEEERRLAVVVHIVERADVPATGILRAFQAVGVVAVVVLILDAPLLLAQLGKFQETDGGPEEADDAAVHLDVEGAAQLVMREFYRNSADSVHRV